MKLVIQRVTSANISYDSELYSINKGIVVLAGFIATDTNKIIEHMIDKIYKLRIFEDEKGLLNKSLRDIGGDLLFVPNFTIYGDASGGNRPSFSKSASFDTAKPMYEHGVEYIKNTIDFGKCAFGRFGADMSVSIINDGPCTLILEEI